MIKYFIIISVFVICINLVWCGNAGSSTSSRNGHNDANRNYKSRNADYRSSIDDRKRSDSVLNLFNSKSRQKKGKENNPPTAVKKDLLEVPKMYQGIKFESPLVDKKPSYSYAQPNLPPKQRHRGTFNSYGDQSRSRYSNYVYPQPSWGRY